jgi:hypothetical protein
MKQKSSDCKAACWCWVVSKINNLSSMRRPDMDKLDYGPIIAEDADKDDEDLDMRRNCGQNL